MPANEPYAATHRIVVVPNRSLSLTGLWFFYASISLVSLAVALWFTLHGFWPVLAWAGFDMLLLGVCLYICWRRGGYAEVITVSGTRVTVEKGDGRHRESLEFNRHWAQVVMQEPDSRLHPRRLCLRSHGRECEVGRCLTEAERETLARRLGEIIGPVGHSGEYRDAH